VENCIRRLADAQHRLRLHHEGHEEHEVEKGEAGIGERRGATLITSASKSSSQSLRELRALRGSKSVILPRAERFRVVFSATREVITPSIFGGFIIMVVYLPILTLSGVEGKMFVPMAFTVLLALSGAMLFSLTFVPAAVAIFLKGEISEQENIVMRWAKKVYVPLLHRSMHHRPAVVIAAAVLVALSFLLASRMGTEFIPSLDEGDIALEASRIPGIGLTQSVEIQRALDTQILRLPQVKEVFSRIGTAEIASDPMPPSSVDVTIMLKPRAEWPNPRLAKEDLIKQLEAEIENVPGINFEVTQPIQLRFNELISGVRSDVGVKIFGDDMEVLAKAGERIAAALRTVPGNDAVKVEPVGGLPMLTIKLKRETMARYGLSFGEVQQVLETAIGGSRAGHLFEGDRLFPLVVRLPENLRNDLDSLRRIPISLPDATTKDTKSTKRDGAGFSSSFVSSVPFVVSSIPLSEIAEFDMTPGPNQISRENGKRRIVVTCNIRGRDIGSFVTEAQQKIRDTVKIPPGYWVAWGGQFEQLQSATKRLQIVVPLALLLIFVLLFMAFGSVKDSLLVFTGVPLALTGGIMALWLRDISLSISAGVGFIALSGVAVLNGIVMVSFINHLRAEGKGLDESITEGAVTRLRPVLMTALVAALGFVPMALAHGRGAEVQKPLATVVIGGIISSTILTLLVLPALYRMFHKHGDLKPADFNESNLASKAAL
jgi:cobalt-zinc-cadmium resistance protein CzcA